MHFENHKMSRWIGCTWLVAHLALAASAKPRPNIVFLLTDDQAPNTIHALGNDHIITPTLDKMVEEGIHFDGAYCHGSYSSAVCLASRHMLVTGQNWQRLNRKKVPKSCQFGGRSIQKGFAYPETPTLPQLFNDAGYYTGALIKKGPSPKALESDFTYTHELDAGLDRLGGFCGKNPVDEAFKFLDAYDQSPAKKTGAPYFLYIGFPGPHDERFIDQKYLDLYLNTFGEKPPLPPNYLPFYPYANGFTLFGRDHCLVSHPRTEELIRTELLYYYGMITSIDEHVARLMDRLKERGEFENTIFVYTSDHGLSLGEHGLTCKQNLYEESMKAPMLLMGPGIPKGKRSTAQMYLHDLFATFCDFAQIPVPAGLHSKSIMPMIQGERETHRETIYLPYINQAASLKQGPWKLIKFLKVKQPQLFHLENDPYEMHDLAGHPEHAERIATMEAELEKIAREHGAESKVLNQKYAKHMQQLLPITEEEVIQKRAEYDQSKGLPIQAIKTREARMKSNHNF